MHQYASACRRLRSVKLAVAAIIAGPPSQCLSRREEATCVRGLTDAIRYGFSGFACRRWAAPAGHSDQLERAEAGMPGLADDDVIVDIDAKRLGDLDHGFRHIDIGA